MADRERQGPGGRDDGEGGLDDDAGGSDRGDPREGKRRKGRRVSFFWFKKRKKSHRRKKHRTSSSGCWAKRVLSGGGGGGGCFLCLKKPETVDSSGESPTSDPNSAEFTADMLRALIEKNDFYSKECNPHLDVTGDVS